MCVLCILCFLAIIIIHFNVISRLFKVTLQRLRSKNSLWRDLSSCTVCSLNMSDKLSFLSNVFTFQFRQEQKCKVKHHLFSRKVDEWDFLFFLFFYPKCAEIKRRVCLLIHSVTQEVDTFPMAIKCVS